MCSRVCLRRGVLIALVLLGAGMPGSAQQNAPVDSGSIGKKSAAKPKLPHSLRVYVIDCGTLNITDVKMFGLQNNEVETPTAVDTCYLIAHPKGLLMWDTGVISDKAFDEHGGPVSDGPAVATKSLKSQLVAIGYAPGDVKYLGLSHYHSDHTANANEFAGATWLVRKAERDAMFSEKPPPAVDPKSFSELKNSKTIIISTDDYDVFGDGTVIIKSAPGHTPGHQVLFLKLAHTGPVLIAGDLYHYPAEWKLNRVPVIEFDKHETLATRAKIEDFVKKTGATLWIEHDSVGRAKLKKAPDFYE
jgi:N-acyl homoserine lactone hydrolase